MTWGSRIKSKQSFCGPQALLGLEREQEARTLLREVLQLDRNHPGAADLVEQIEWGFKGAGKML